MPKSNDFAQHARNILAKMSKVPKPDVKPTKTGVSLPTAPTKQYYHPEVYKQVSMHIAERLKKLGT